jgi:Arc/MetJ-type ribon-helix-helix transcriptional regulator
MATMQLPTDVQDWIERQVEAGAFKTPAEAIAFAVRQVAPAGDDLSWAKPLVDEAMAEIARGEGIPRSEAMQQVRAHIAARQAQWPTKSS